MKLLDAYLRYARHGNYIVLTLLLFVITTITACSGGSASPVASGEDSNGSSVLTGVFVDSPVEGLNYKTATMSGVTDEFGTFTYHAGETVTFMIGDVMLGSAPGSTIMTPIDLVPGAMDEKDPTVTNICRLLQSLDWDGDPANGIMLTETIRSEMTGRMIDFAKNVDEFNDYDVQAFFDTMHILGGFSDGSQRGLRTPVEARDHFRWTLMENGMYPGDGSPGSGQPETGMNSRPGGNSMMPADSFGGVPALMNN